MLIATKRANNPVNGTLSVCLICTPSGYIWGEIQCSTGGVYPIGSLLYGGYYRTAASAANGAIRRGWTITNTED